jgi:hypothetical protein
MTCQWPQQRGLLKNFAQETLDINCSGSLHQGRRIMTQTTPAQRHHYANASVCYALCCTSVCQPCLSQVVLHQRDYATGVAHSLNRTFGGLPVPVMV